MWLNFTLFTNNHYTRLPGQTVNYRTTRIETVIKVINLVTFTYVFM